MTNSPSFVDHALDLLSGVGPVRARAMFGGHGIYCRGVMFALIDDDDLFLKTDAECRAEFVAAGCVMWTYPGMATTSYFRPPDVAHEDPEAMHPWASLALQAALRASAAKAQARPRRTRSPAPRSRSRGSSEKTKRR